MPSNGPLYGTNNYATGDGTFPQSDPAQVAIDDGMYDVWDFGVGAPVDSAGETCGTDTFAGLSLPFTAIPTGFLVEIKHRCRDTVDGMQDNSVRLTKFGAPVGDNKASSVKWNTALETYTYGGDGELWGTTWTRNDAINMGIEFIPMAEGGQFADVDFIRLTIYYRLPGAPQMMLMGVGM